MADLQAVPSSPAQELAEVAPTSPADLARDGERLYVAMRCGLCHGAEREEVIPGLPPDLSYAGSKLREDWIRDYLLEPHPIRYRSDSVRPILRMPDYRLSDDEAGALAAYLATRTNVMRFASVTSEQGATSEQAAEGKRLFADYQCLGCHVVESEGNRIGPDLTHVGARLKAVYLDVFLREPEAVIPGTSMKNYELWDEERTALVAFLQSRK